jgi:hypothetical protein
MILAVLGVILIISVSSWSCARPRRHGRRGAPAGSTNPARGLGALLLLVRIALRLDLPRPLNDIPPEFNGSSIS